MSTSTRSLATSLMSMCHFLVWHVSDGIPKPHGLILTQTPPCFPRTQPLLMRRIIAVIRKVDRCRGALWRILRTQYNGCTAAKHHPLWWVNALRPRQNGRYFTDDIFKCISFNENSLILNEISLKYVPWHLINNMAALVQIMAWRLPHDKSLSEPMMA